MISFSFPFLCLPLVVVDCFALLAITVHPHRHCEGRRPVAISLFLASHCESFLASHCESCLQLVAISVWGIIIHSWNSFSFWFLCLLLVVCGGLASLCKGGCCEATGGLREKLKIKNWKLIHKKLKIEAQSEKMISLLNHFSLLSYEVRNERSIRNWKLKIKNWKLIFHLKLIL